MGALRARVIDLQEGLVVRLAHLHFIYGNTLHMAQYSVYVTTLAARDCPTTSRGRTVKVGHCGSARAIVGAAAKGSKISRAPVVEDGRRCQRSNRSFTFPSADVAIEQSVWLAYLGHGFPLFTDIAHTELLT